MQASKKIVGRLSRSTPRVAIRPSQALARTSAVRQMPSRAMMPATARLCTRAPTLRMTRQVQRNTVRPTVYRVVSFSQRANNRAIVGSKTYVRGFAAAAAAPAKTFKVEPTLNVERVDFNVVNHPYTLGWRTPFFQAINSFKDALRVETTIDLTNNYDVLKKWKTNPELSKFPEAEPLPAETNFETALEGIPSDFKTPILKQLQNTRTQVKSVFEEWKKSLPADKASFYFGSTEESFDYLCKVYNLKVKPSKEQLANFDLEKQQKLDDQEVSRIKNMVAKDRWISGPKGQMFRYEVKTAEPRIAARVVEDLKKDWGEAVWFTTFYEYGQPSKEGLAEAAEFLKVQ